MHQDRRSPWKACVGILLLMGLIMGFVFYPDYDTLQTRQQLLQHTIGADVQIVAEVEQGGTVICQLRAEGQVGYARFRDFIGKTLLEEHVVTNSDRMARTLQLDGENMILLICDQPGLHHALIHYQDLVTGAYAPGEPIDMEGLQMVLVPHDPDLGAHGFTEYFDADGDPI